MSNNRNDVGSAYGEPGVPPPPPLPPVDGGQQAASPSAPPPKGVPQREPGAGSGGQPARDRLVVLGRRRAGKTIYLARLYEMAWNDRAGGLHMRAVPGPTNGHEKYMQTVESLKIGRWPESTVDDFVTEIDIEYRGDHLRMVALDYPGEVFRRAFVNASEEDGAVALRDHVDRAAGVIILLDPEVAVAGTISESMDDDYGMSEAIRRIRESPGGGEVPVAMVLTKCDSHLSLVKEAGGLRAFTDRYYHNIIRPARGQMRRFAAAAVRVRADARGREVPTLHYDPVNVTEPLVYCLDKILEGKRRGEEREYAAAASRRRLMIEQEALDIERRKSEKLAVGLVVAVVAFGALFAVLWFRLGPGANDDVQSPGTSSERARGER